MSDNQKVFYEGLVNNVTVPAQQPNTNNFFALPAQEPKARQKYNNVATTIDKSQAIEIGCAEIFFLNQGTAPVTINSVIVLQQFQFIAFSGNEDEEDTTHYTCIFGAGTKNCIIIRKVYTS